MSSRTQALLLLLFGAALLRIGSTDVLLRFVRPSARLWVLTAGSALLLLAVWSLVVDARHGGAEQQVDEHGHHGATRLAWLVAAPVIAVLVITPQALGAFSADRRDSVVTTRSPGAGSGGYDPLPPGDPVTLTMFDLATRAVLGHGTTLRGRTLRVLGFVAGMHDGEVVLARLVITCCAADAAPVFLRVRAPVTANALPRNTWVQTQGVFTGVATDGSDVPVLQASSMRQVPAPGNPYD